MTAHGRMLQSWEDYRILLLEGVKLVLGEEAAENFELRVPEGRSKRPCAVRRPKAAGGHCAALVPSACWQRQVQREGGCGCLSIVASSRWSWLWSSVHSGSSSQLPSEARQYASPDQKVSAQGLEKQDHI